MCKTSLFTIRIMDKKNIFWFAQKLAKSACLGRSPKISAKVSPLYTRYPIVTRRAWPAGCTQPLGRVRRASKGILHTSFPYGWVFRPTNVSKISIPNNNQILPRKYCAFMSSYAKEYLERQAKRCIQETLL